MQQIAGFVPVQATTVRPLVERASTGREATVDGYSPTARAANDVLSPAHVRAFRSAPPTGTRPYYDAKADAADRAAYYGGLETEAAQLDPKALFDRLSDLVTKTHTTVLDYSPSSELYPVVDRHPDGKLHSIYTVQSGVSCDVSKHASRAQSVATAAAGSGPAFLAAVSAADEFNCEHVVPQSWFDKKLPMRGDLHHLFACDPGCNSLRGSFPYSDEPDNGSACGTVSAGKDGFEPATGKGPVARATLYFLLRYPGQVGDEPGEYSADDIKTLLEWSKNDPVGEYEQHRNAEIFRKQGNRNPLIDHPEWTERIDFARGLGHRR